MYLKNYIYIFNFFSQYVLSRQKTIIINLYKDTLSKNPYVIYTDLYDDISKATGIGHRTIKDTINEYRKSSTVTSPNRKRVKTSLFDKTDDLDRSGLR